MEKFTVLHSDAGDFKDYSIDASDFSRDDFILDLVSADDYLYIGYRKPWSFFYIEMQQVNTISTILDAEYYNGSAWSSISGLRDESKSLTRSGFISHDKPSDWTATAVDGSELFWVRYKPQADLDLTTEVRGIGIVFSDDNDLKEEIAEISKKLPRDESSFILKHVASRKEMIQEIRNRGYKKNDTNAASAQRLMHVTEFDFFYPDKEMRQASKMLTLQKIFFNNHDDVEDVNRGKADEFMKKHDRLFNTFFLSFDQNDDGELDADEALAVDRIELVRD